MSRAGRHTASVVESAPMQAHNGQRLLVECGGRQYTVLLVMTPEGRHLPVISPVEGFPNRDVAYAAALAGIERIVNGNGPG